MKKLMVAAAVVCAAIYGQAAAVNWNSGTITKPDTTETDGIYKFTSSTKSSNKVGNAVTAYLWIVGVEDYASYTSQSAIYDALWSHRTDATGDYKPTKSVQSSSSTANMTTDGYAAGKNVYGVVLYEYSDGVDTFYVAQKAMATIGSVSETGDDATVATMVKGGASTAFTNAGWTKISSGDVPEPTSAMLLLLGVAGLALKRKRA